MTVLRIVVQPDGTGSRPEVIKSSGVPALDYSALSAVVAALPLPPPPKMSEGASAAVFDLGFRVVGNDTSNDAAAGDTHDLFPVMTANCEYPVPGVVDPLDVRRTVETYRRELTTCVDAQRDAAAEPVGEVAIEFVITEAGSVYRQTIVKTGGLPRSLERCLLRTMSDWTFRQPTRGAVKVVFPFRFSEGQASGADIRSGVNTQGRLPQ